MKYILTIAFLLANAHAHSQPWGDTYYDKDSNSYVIANGDTQYLQHSYSKPFTDWTLNFGKNAVFINTDENYKYNPHFRGSLPDYIEQHLQYPKEAVKKGIEGKITVTFIVDEHGYLHDIRTFPFRGNGSAKSILAKEAIRLVENMPPWQAARNREDGITPVSAPGGLTIPFELF